MIVRAELRGQDLIEAEKTENGWRLKSVGCSQFMKRVRELTERHPNPENWLTELEGKDHVDLLLREFAMKVRGEWDYPYKEEELCHCRNVALRIVDEAIMNGAHTPEAVSRKTSASTSCGTCRADVKKILEYRKAV